jgi:hypothetical protein
LQLNNSPKQQSNPGDYPQNNEPMNQFTFANQLRFFLTSLEQCHEVKKKRRCFVNSEERGLEQKEQPKQSH